MHDFVGLPVLGQRVDFGEEVAAGGLSGPMLSGSVSIDKAVKLAKLLLKLSKKSENNELAKFGKPHWQQIQEQLLA